MSQNANDRSLGELFAELAKETGTLVRQEVALAKTEMTQKAAEVGKNIGFLAVGGAIVYAGLLGILAAIVIGLATLGLPWWLSALLVGIVVAAIGYFLVQKGLSALKQASLAPQKTIDSLKEDADWVKEKAR